MYFYTSGYKKFGNSQWVTVTKVFDFSRSPASTVLLFSATSPKTITISTTEVSVKEIFTVPTITELLRPNTTLNSEYEYDEDDYKDEYDDDLTDDLPSEGFPTRRPQQTDRKIIGNHNKFMYLLR